MILGPNTVRLHLLRLNGVLGNLIFNRFRQNTTPPEKVLLYILVYAHKKTHAKNDVGLPPNLFV